MTFFAENIPLLAAATVLVASLLLGLLARWLLRSRLERWVRATTSRADDVIVHSLPPWVPLWFTVGGALVALTIAAVPPHVESTLRKVITSVAILSAAFWVADVALRFLQRNADLPGGAATRTAGAVRLVVRVVVIGLGALMVLISLCVIGSHGLLSGTATMDFGGRKGAGTAVGVIDGAVYLGTALQSLSLGYLTTRDWSYWPIFLIPFGVAGFLLTLRIWHAKPKPRAH